jgi:hypothetical protein
VLLAALVAYPALGPELLRELHAKATPETTWLSFVDSLEPRWPALATALREITRAAAEQGLPLPEHLTAWTEWLVPVGRLSFPAGQVVNDL